MTFVDSDDFFDITDTFKNLAISKGYKNTLDWASNAFERGLLCKYEFDQLKKIVSSRNGKGHPDGKAFESISITKFLLFYSLMSKLQNDESEHSEYMKKGNNKASFTDFEAKKIKEAFTTLQNDLEKKAVKNKDILYIVDSLKSIESLDDRSYISSPKIKDILSTIRYLYEDCTDKTRESLTSFFLEMRRFDFISISIENTTIGSFMVFEDGREYRI